MSSQHSQRQALGRHWLRPVPYPWVVVGLLLISQMASAWPGMGLPVLYPFIQKELGLSRAQVGLITSALMGGGITTVFLGGWLTDVLGVKRVMVTALLMLALLMFTFVLAHSLFIILVIAALVGVWEAPGYPASTRAIMDWLPRKVRGLAMSAKQTGVAWGAAIAAGLLPVVAVAAGWRAGTAVLAGLILAVGLVFYAFYRDAPREGFAVRRMSLKVLRVLVQNRGLVMVTMWGSAFVALQFIVLSYVILFLVEGLGMPEVVAGGYLAVAHIGSIVARVGWGAISDFLFGTRRVAVLAILGMATTAGLVGIALVDASAPRVIVVLLVALLGITALSWHGVFTILVGELAGVAQTGTALGAVNTVMRVSMIVMPPLFGLLVDLTDSYPIGWGAAAAMALVSTVALVALGRDPQRA